MNFGYQYYLARMAQRKVTEMAGQSDFAADGSAGVRAGKVEYLADKRIVKSAKDEEVGERLKRRARLRSTQKPRPSSEESCQLA